MQMWFRKKNFKWHELIADFKMKVNKLQMKKNCDKFVKHEFAV